jgi:endonuclease/exonuclease/phosphatase family metal-dependent hydrolase
MSSHFRIVTYNIHKCRGLDRRASAARIAEVLKEINADIIALQEVWSIESAMDERHQAAFIARELGMEWRAGIVREFDGGVYGNVTLSRLPLSSSENYDLTWRGREPRGCLRVDVELRAGNETTARLHFFNVHLGTAFIERRHQARRLISAHVLENPNLYAPRIILGDFNEWTRGLATQLLMSKFKCADYGLNPARVRSYPGVFPFMHLDHIYYDPALHLKHSFIHRSRRALVASDHLPLVADFQIVNRK